MRKPRWLRPCSCIKCDILTFTTSFFMCVLFFLMGLPHFDVLFRRNILLFVNSAISIAIVLIITSLLPITLKLRMLSKPEDSSSTCTGTTVFSSEKEDICWNDYASINLDTVLCRSKCINGTFSLPGMIGCHPWLNCADITAINIVREIGTGAVKKISMGMWNEYAVAIATPIVYQNLANYETDFKSGLDSLIELGHNDRLVQLVGFCRNPLTVVTEYHKFGNAALFLDLLQMDKYKSHDAMLKRFRLCLDYVEILAWLHATPSGPRVMCDSSSLEKTLQQYLLTDDLRLRLNDVDALPQVRHGVPIKCGHRQLIGDFVAPEQRWPYPEREFDDQLMAPYDEKTDIWKIPDVCDYFVRGAKNEDLLQHHLFNIHKKCKARNPAERPTAEQVLAIYKDAFSHFNPGGS